MRTNYVLLIGFTQPNRCNSQRNKNQRHRKFGLVELLLLLLPLCVCIKRTFYILYQSNWDMVWCRLGRCCCCWCRRRRYTRKIRNCSENQLSNSIQRARTQTHSNDTLEFIVIQANRVGLSEQEKGKDDATVVFSNFADTSSVNICNSSLWCEHSRKPANITTNQLKHGIFFGTSKKK